MHPALDPKNNPEFAKIQDEVMQDVFTVSHPVDDSNKKPSSGEENVKNSQEDGVDVTSPDTSSDSSSENGYDGYKNYDEYIADGGDPDFYRGKEAYKQQKELIQEKRNTESRFKERIDALEKQMVNLALTNEQQRKKEIQDLKKKIEVAKVNDDTEGLDSAYKELNSISDTPEIRPKYSPSPSVVEFIANEPRLDTSSPKFDASYYAQFDAVLSQGINNAQSRIGRQLSDVEIRQHLEYTHNQLNSGNKSDNQETLNPNRNRPNKVGAPRSSSKSDPITKMDVHTKGLYERWSKSRNRRDRDLAKMLLKKYEG